MIASIVILVLIAHVFAESYERAVLLVNIDLQSQKEGCLACFSNNPAAVWCKRECDSSNTVVFNGGQRSCRTVGCDVNEDVVTRSSSGCNNERDDVDSDAACFSVDVDGAIDTAVAIGTTCLIVSIVIPICIVICVIVVIVIIARQSNRGGQTGAVVAQPQQQGYIVQQPGQPYMVQQQQQPQMQYQPQQQQQQVPVMTVS